jgi:hypothetical protein
MSYPPSGGTPEPDPRPSSDSSSDPTTAYPTPPFTPSGPAAEPYAPPTSGSQFGTTPPAPYGAGYEQPPGYASAQPYATYGQAPYAPQYAQPYPGYGMQSRTNGLAIASLVCSLAGLLTCISAPVGIVLGHIARRQIRQTGEQGDGLATAGLWVGYILTVLGVLGVIAYGLLIAFAIRHTNS